eukprot:gene2765-36819_t
MAPTAGAPAHTTATTTGLAAAPFAALAAGVVVLHGAAAACQERAFLAPGYRFPWFHTAFEFLVYAALLGHGLGVLSLIYLNYTTSTLLKASKVPATLVA